MTGVFSPDVTALDWPTVRGLVVARGSWTLGAVPPAARAQVAEAAGKVGLAVRHEGHGRLVVILQERRNGSAGPRLPRGKARR